MALITPNMGLTAWDLAGDFYDHDQLADNVLAVDVHNHTAGKGVQIPTGGIVDLAITEAKLAANSVSTVKIVNASVTSEKLAPGAVIPVGTVISWWRPSSSVSVPSGWAVPTGQSLTSANHDFAGGGTIVLPDLRNKFIMGADTSATGTSTSTPPDIGYTGGSHTTSLSHTHTVDAHSHTVAAHSHTVPAHLHSVSDHNHVIISDSGHDHKFVGGYQLASRQTNTTAQSTPTGDDSKLQTMYVPGFNTGQTSTSVPMDNGGAHSHGGYTGGLSGGVSTGSTALTSDTAAPSTSTSSPGTGSALGSVDTRPAFVGMLLLMKVKN